MWRERGGEGGDGGGGGGMGRGWGKAYNFCLALASKHRKLINSTSRSLNRDTNEAYTGKQIMFDLTDFHAPYTPRMVGSDNSIVAVFSIKK